jgi:hypothetical protein
MEVSMAPEELPRTDESRSVVTIHSPEGRVFLWLGAASPVMSWRVGDAVDFRSSAWVVMDRTEEGESLSLTLGAAA